MSSDPTPTTLLEEDFSIAGNTVGDHPTSFDSLGFKPYVEAIAGFLTSTATKPPITISIEGEWGSGKSSFLLQLEEAICGPPPGLLRFLPAWLGGTDSSKTFWAALKAIWRDDRPLTLRFNAWRHDKQDQLWAAFALAFVDSLRKEIGWPRALWGDLRLFLKRLHGLRAWLQLALLAVCLFILLLAAIRYRALVPEFWRRLHAMSRNQIYALIDQLTKPDPHPDAGSSALHHLAEHGTWGALASLAIAGILKFRSWFKMPLSLDLQRYITRPDYEGHTAFIESFHVDLTRLVLSYAGKKRVVIFIDDLDRCDVPRAAELMQAINLMISDSQNLIFVLGMDREKVAAGIALKYKDLFPYLRESAKWKPGEDDFIPLYFGYAYLEKFIQLSFSLPIANSEAALKQFLTPPPDPVAVPSWLKRVRADWKTRKISLFTDDSFEPNVTITRHTSTPAGENPTRVEESVVSIGMFGLRSSMSKVTETHLTLPPPSPPAKVIYNRVIIKEENDRTRRIVEMTAPLFEYNPRRIKQFTNTFRLALFIASDQGIFDRLDGAARARTPEQVGKVIALMLRFPDLRLALELNPATLAELEKKAIFLRMERMKNPDAQADARFAHWLDKPGAIDLLTYNLGFNRFSGDQLNYSLADFDVTQLFTVLPRASRPPAPVPKPSPFAHLSDLPQPQPQPEQAKSQPETTPKTNADSQSAITNPTLATQEREDEEEVEETLSSKDGDHDKLTPNSIIAADIDVEEDDDEEGEDDLDPDLDGEEQHTGVDEAARTSSSMGNRADSDKTLEYLKHGAWDALIALRDAADQAANNSDNSAESQALAFDIRTAAAAQLQALASALFTGNAVERQTATATLEPSMEHLKSLRVKISAFSDDPKEAAGIASQLDNALFRLNVIKQLIRSAST